MPGGNIACDRRSCPDGRSRTHGDRCDEGGVGPDEYVVSNYSLVLVGAVVIAGDGTRADVDALANITISNIAEMIDLGASAYHGFLDFNEIADFGLLF